MRLLHAIIVGASTAAMAGGFAWLIAETTAFSPVTYLVTLIGVKSAWERWERGR